MQFLVIENTFGAIRLHCDSNSNPSVGQFVDALRTVIINGLAYRSLYGTNCEDDGASLLDKLHSFLKPSNASSTSPSTSHDSEITDTVPDIVHIGKEAQCGVSATVRACKGKAVPLQAWTGPESSRKLRFPDFMTTAQDGGKIVSLTHRPPLPPGNAPGTHFC